MEPNTENHKDSDIDKKRATLGSLYPTAKSYTQLAEARERHEREFEQRKPHHVFVSTSLRLYSVLIGIVLAAIAIPNLITFNVISGVFFSFFIALILLGYIIWIMHLISSTLYRVGFDAKTFLILYIGIYIGLISGAYAIFMRSSAIVQFSVATLLHYTLVFILIRILTSASKNTG